MVVSVWYKILLVFSTSYIWNTHAVPQGSVSGTKNKDLQDGILAFGHDLLKIEVRRQVYSEPEENTIISPINIYMCLMLAYIGTGAGKTRSELATALHLQNPNETNHFTAVSESLSQIIKTLENRPSSYNQYTEESLASGIFAQQSFPLRDEYKKLVHKYFSAEITNLDFAGHAREATDYINKWVSQKTKGRIQKLYPSPIDESTDIVLTSAVYFRGEWEHPFSVSKTKTEKFNTGVREVEVQMMHALEKIPYITDGAFLGFEAIKLNYADRDYQMIFILPHETQNIDSLVQKLKVEDLLAIFDNKGRDGITNGVDYKIPRMKFSWSKPLKDALQRKGVRALFKSANLSLMTNMIQRTTKVSNVDHAADIEIDEIGTKASAVTAGGVQVLSYSPRPISPKQFHCNRPFMMLLVNRPTRTISFSAVVHQPTSE